MKQGKKKEILERDDSLYGLLSGYKKFTSYVRVMISPDNDVISVQITSNPKNWEAVDEEKYSSYTKMRRIHLGSNKSLVKYLSPDLLIKVTGPLLGIRIPSENAEINNRIKDDDIYIIETPMRYKEDIIEGVSRLLNMAPQKKYELLENYMSDIQE